MKNRWDETVASYRTDKELVCDFIWRMRKCGKNWNCGKYIFGIPIPVFFLGKPHEQSSLAGCSSQRHFPGSSVCKESTCNAGDPDWIPWLEGSLEKGMAIHSSILAWEVSSTEKPGRLSSMGSQRVGHDWMTKPSPPLTEIVERTSVIPELWSCVTPLFLMSVWYTLAGLEHGQETLSTLLI